MIGFIKGILLFKKAPDLLIEVNGLGYELTAPLSTFEQLPEIGHPVQLYTHLLVREDAHLFYGFSTESERFLFRELLKISGVGGKLALNILSQMNVAQFCACIQSEDQSTLVKLPGVGKKTAQRLILEMKDRLLKQPLPEPLPDQRQDAIQALIALGYKPEEAKRRVQSIQSANMSTEDLIKHALKSI